MVALPGQLFYSTQIPVCLWFLARDRKGGKFRDRRGEVLLDSHKPVDNPKNALSAPLRRSPRWVDGKGSARPAFGRSWGFIGATRVVKKAGG